MVWFTVPYCASVDGQRLSDLHWSVTFNKCINSHLNLPVTLVEMQGNGYTCRLWTIHLLALFVNNFVSEKLEASFDQRWWFITPFIVRLSVHHSCFLISGHVSFLFVLRAINLPVFNFRFSPKIVEKLEIWGDRWPTLLNVTTFVVRHSTHFPSSYLFGFCIVSVY
jgi:hypothetical protein